MIQSESIREYVVEGMACSHGMLSVTEEVSEVAGVVDIDLELQSGRLVVRGAGVSDDAVRAAVAEVVA